MISRDKLDLCGCDLFFGLHLILHGKLYLCGRDDFFSVFINIFQFLIGSLELVGDAKGVPASEKVKNHCFSTNASVYIFVAAPFVVFTIMTHSLLFEANKMKMNELPLLLLKESIEHGCTTQMTIRAKLLKITMPCASPLFVDIENELP